jgi:GNAT superfamily N-acetyltransferase
VILLWHGNEPIGVCVFATPAASLTLRTRYFRLADPRSEVGMRGLNANLWLLQRVVLHPTYRGAGIAAAFVRRACELCPVDWIETLTAMGRVNPFFERAGFVRVGTIRKRDGDSGGAFARRGTAKPDTHRYSEPAYFVRDNRRGGR